MSPKTKLVAALSELTPAEMSELVKQEAFGSVPDDIAVALRQEPDLWYRTIVTIVSDINEQIARRKALYLGGTMPPDDVRDYNAWRAKALSVKSRLEIRVVEARALRRQANMAEAEQATQRKLGKLHAAVTAHRAALQSEDYEATDHDLDLWRVLAEIDAGLHDQPPAV